MGGNDYYVIERPNPEALTHTEIFERLVKDGTGVSGIGPTEPLLTNGESLFDGLQELAGMVGSLEVSFQAGSTGLALQAIDRVASQIGGDTSVTGCGRLQWLRRGVPGSAQPGTTDAAVCRAA